MNAVIRHYAPTFILSVLISLAGPQAWAKGGTISWPAHACTPTEVWTGDVPMVKYLQDRMSPLNQKPETATRTLVQASQSLQNITKNPKTAANGIFVEYVLSRTLFSLNLVHPAFKKFQDILAAKDVPGSAGIKFAALSCINEIQVKYPTFGPLPEKLLPLIAKLAADRTLPREVRNAALAATLRRAEQRIAAGATEPDLQAEFQILKDSGAPEAAARVVLASNQSSETDIVAFSKTVGNRNAMHLAMGRAFYGLGKYEQAIEHFKKVTSPSREIQDAILGLAWSYLMLEKKTDALSNASNLLLGGLSKGFAPEAFSVTAIALNETCNYPDALNIVKSFHKAYGRTWQWLNSWHVNKVKKPQDFYRLLGVYLKNPRSLPQRIGIEWARSPVFLANQAEINLLMDETLAARKVGRALAKIRTPLALWLDMTIVELKPREDILAAEISNDLAAKNEQMLEQLNDVTENLQFVEAEVYNSLGDRIISAEAETESDKDNAANPNPVKHRRKKDEVSTWDWGKFTVNEDSEQAEVWEDELGCLRSNVEDKCR